MKKATVLIPLALATVIGGSIAYYMHNIMPTQKAEAEQAGEVVKAAEKHSHKYTLTEANASKSTLTSPAYDLYTCECGETQYKQAERLTASDLMRYSMIAVYGGQCSAYEKVNNTTLATSISDSIKLETKSQTLVDGFEKDFYFFDLERNGNEFYYDETYTKFTITLEETKVEYDHYLHIQVTMYNK